MRAILALSLLGFVLVGCGASTKTTAMPASNTNAPALTSLDSTPPGDMEFSFKRPEKSSGRSNDDNAVSFRPNVQQKPSRGAVHAAY